MIRITSAANCFVDSMNQMGDVYRIDFSGNVSETGVQMSVSEEIIHGAPYRMENVSFGTALKALNKVKSFFPGMVVKIMSAAPVLDGGMPAIGTTGTNFFIVLGNAIALAPVWILLENSVLTPATSGMTAKDIEAVVSQRGGGLWGKIMDYTEGPTRA